MNFKKISEWWNGPAIGKPAYKALPEGKSIDVLYEVIEPVVKAQLESQSRSADGLGTRAGFLLAGSGVLLTAISPFISRLPGGDFSPWLWGSLGTLILTFLFSIVTIRTRVFKLGLYGPDFFNKHITDSPDEVKKAALVVINEALLENRNNLIRTAHYYELALIFFMLCVVSTIIMVITQAKPASGIIKQSTWTSQTNNHLHHPHYNPIQQSPNQFNLPQLPSSQN